jgi:hypothetical protein
MLTFIILSFKKIVSFIMSICPQVKAAKAGVSFNKNQFCMPTPNSVNQVSFWFGTDHVIEQVAVSHK